MEKKKIAVAGAGYVGLSLAVLLAQKNEVYLYDISEEKTEMIRRGISPVRDRELEEYLASKKLNLNAVSDAKTAFAGSVFIIVAVPTDYEEKTGRFNTSAVESVLSLAEKYAPEAFSVIRSTVPVGYTSSVRKKTGNRNIFFSPEFLRETKALYDNLYPSRIIAGIDPDDPRQTEAAGIFLSLLQEGARKRDPEILIMKSSEAEAVKLFSNAYLAMRVSFFNELDTYAELKGLDTQRIIRGVCLDPRIGDWYNNPGFGYGGYCLPKDTKQLLSDYGGIPQSLIRSIVDANDMRKDFIAGRVLSLAGYTAEPSAPSAVSAASAASGTGRAGRFSDPADSSDPEKLSAPADSSGVCVIGVYRLIMKSGSDNFRHSAVLDIIERLRRENGIYLLIYEPALAEDAVPAGCRVTSDLNKFKTECRIILANRFEEALADVKEKVYTRDVYHRD